MPGYEIAHYQAHDELCGKCSRWYLGINRVLNDFWTEGGGKSFQAKKKKTRERKGKQIYAKRQALINPPKTIGPHEKVGGGGIFFFQPTTVKAGTVKP